MYLWSLNIMFNWKLPVKKENMLIGLNSLSCLKNINASLSAKKQVNYNLSIHFYNN